MAFKFSEYTSDFREKAVADGFKYVTREALSIIPAAIGHLLDVLLGMDGLIGKDRYNYLHGPFGALLGFPFLGLGYVIGFIMQSITLAPAFLGSMLDLAITKIQKIFFDVYGPAAFDQAILNTMVGMAASHFLYALPTSLALPERMQGPFGFGLGLIPALAQHFVNRLAAVGSAIIKYPVDHFSDAVNYVYSGILSGLQKLFSKKKVVEDSTAQLGEEEPLVNDMKPKKKRISRKKDLDDKALEDDPALKKVLADKVNLFSALAIDRDAYITAPRAEQENLVNKGYKQQVKGLHPDKRLAEAKEDKEELDKQWQTTLTAKTILSDAAKSKLYISKLGLFKPQARQVQVAPTNVDKEKNTQQAANDETQPEQEKPRRIKITRTRGK